MNPSICTLLSQASRTSRLWTIKFILAVGAVLLAGTLQASDVQLKAVVAPDGISWYDTDTVDIMLRPTVNSQTPDGTYEVYGEKRVNDAESGEVLLGNIVVAGGAATNVSIGVHGGAHNSPAGGAWNCGTTIPPWTYSAAYSTDDHISICSVRVTAVKRNGVTFQFNAPAQFGAEVNFYFSRTGYAKPTFTSTVGYLDIQLGPLPASPPSEPGGTKPTDVMTGGEAGSQGSENSPPNGPNCGMLRYGVHSQLVSLHLTDMPLSYVPAFGPKIDFTINYNQRAVQPQIADTQSSVGFSGFGPQWTCNWISYVTDDPADPTQVEVSVRGGGSETYADFDAGTQTYARDRQSQTLLVRTTPNSYEKQFPDGFRYLFTHVDGGTVYPRRVHLTKVIDPFGNEVNLGYNASNRLETITDAAGKVTTLLYELGASKYYRVTKIVDPFGRSASVKYYGDGRLWKIIDAVGIESVVTYEATTNFVNTLVTPYGTTQFASGDDSISRWIEITDPSNSKERVESRDYAPGILDTDTAPPGFLNTGLQMRNTFYWDKKAFLTAPGDYTKARITHWLMSVDGSATTGIVENEKPALERRIWYAYEGQVAGNLAGISDRPIKIARRLDDGSQQLYQNTYNGLGRITSATDPVGRTTGYSYHANGIDLYEIRQVTGGGDVLLGKMENYINHLPQVITDAAGQEVSVTYNSRGQVETLTNAKNEITKYLYDEVGDHPEFGRLLVTTRAFGTALASAATYGYDTYGRTKTVTDSENYTLTFSYDAVGGSPVKSLDRLTRTVFPDATFNELRYDDPRWPLHVAHARDRLSRETAYEYDALGRLVKVTDPQGRATQYVHCPCGAMDKIIDPRGAETEWTRDLQKRVTSKKIDGQTVASYTYEEDTGRLSTITDSLGQTEVRGYFLDDRLHTVTYMNSLHVTPDVTFTYDPEFPRVATMSDGSGVTSYGYVPINPSDAVYGDGKILSVDGPLADDTLTYRYDELGRELGRTINGTVNDASVNYDALGRIFVTVNALGEFDSYFVNQTGRLDHMLWPNGQRTNYLWKANVQDQRLESITHLDPSSTAQSQHVYSYDANGKIVTWETIRPQEDLKFSFGYNGSDELEDVVQRVVPAQTVLHQESYAYDAGGNRVVSVNDGKFASAPANEKNELTTVSGSGAMLFRGTVSEPSTITLAGQPAALAGLNWSAWASVAPGSNSLALVATETNVAPGFNAQATTRQIQLTLTADPDRGFVYDGNGTMTSNAGAQTYEWDAANRLAAINYVGTTNRTECSYDGLGRRVKIVEISGSTIISEKHLLWDGMTIAEERDGSNSVVKRFFDQGVSVGGNSFYYSRDHLGSVRELTDGAGVVRASYKYDSWGVRLKQAGDIDSDFGFTGHYHHEPSGLVAAPFRFYSARLGRWLSPDPIGENGGINLYAYVLNNPINLWDPLGFIWYEDLSNWAHRKVECGKGWLDDSLPWWVAGVGDTALDLLGGIASTPDAIGHLGEGAGTWWGNPTWENSSGMFMDISLAAGVMAGGLAPTEIGNASIGWKGGEVIFTRAGAAKPDLRINPFGGSGYPPHYHRRPGIGKHRPWQGGF